MNLLEKTLFLFFACSASTSFAAMPKQAPHVYSETANAAALKAVQHYQREGRLPSRELELISHLKRLLLEGANPNLIIDKGRSLFIFSLWLNDPELPKLCISHGANVTTQDKDQRTALIEAAHYNLNKQCSQVLIEASRLLDMQDKNGNTALILTCCCEHDMMAKQLLLAGATRTLKNNAGNTAYHAAAKTGSIECMRYLLAARSGTLVNSPDNEPSDEDTSQAPVAIA